jgi:PAS domain S-box-containing protein
LRLNATGVLIVIELADDLESSADGAFVVDEELRIVFANQSAQRMLGFRLDGAPHRYCYRILRGRNDQGRLLCHEFCPVAKDIFSGARVSSFDLQVPTKTEGKRWLNMSIFRYSGKRNGTPYIVHLFRDITQKKRDARFVERVVEAAKHYGGVQPDSNSDQKLARQYGELTRRERQVLTLLVEGHGTREIAQHLSISVNTTRNHVQQILQKLDVHTRLEAVIYAINNGLLD